jgi:polar amino acid transport system substrate-binding protein
LKKGLRILAIALFCAAITASAYAQPASPAAASAPVEAPELRVAAIVVPPAVMEQNGMLTGFSVDLWNAIAARLKVKTSYQVMPDVSPLEEAMRSKNADLQTREYSLEAVGWVRVIAGAQALLSVYLLAMWVLTQVWSAI